MGRPQTVSIKTFPKYDKLHTQITKMMSGISFNTLYPIKETPLFYISCEVWAYCANKFKIKKKNLDKLEVNIPTLTDTEAIKFLADKVWKSSDIAKDGDVLEAKTFLQRLYPNHEYKFFYELDVLFSGYIQGDFISYDRDGNVEEPSEHQLDNRAYYSRKYNQFIGIGKDNEIPHIKTLWDIYQTFNKTARKGKEDDDKGQELYNAYANAQEKYIMEHCDMTEIFIKLGKHGVCLPMAFTNNTAQWSKDKYGKLVGYAHAGECFFIVTPKIIYLNVKRHF
tara:strand:- start:675 stop:1514 length:840 start_codon:yes stop_codon:yes gene_type:complete